MKKSISRCTVSAAVILCFLWVVLGTAAAAEKTIRIGSPFQIGYYCG